MNFRSLLMITVAVGSTLLGSSIAINTHSQTNSSQTSIVLTTRAPQPSTQVTAEFIPQPSQTKLVQPANSSLRAYTPAISTDELNELNIAREQLRRAIHDRNPVLLRSLIQAGSLRQVLTTLAIPEQATFDTLDASTWAVLEKAIAYRCRYPRVQTMSESVSGCFATPFEKSLPY
jgi:hypothetical protein